MSYTAVGWDVHTLDTGVVGQYTSDAIGTNNKPNISYHDVTNGDLKVVRLRSAVTGIVHK